MIVPSNRLIFWVALILVPYSLLAVYSPAVFTMGAVVVALFVLIVVVDIFSSRKFLESLDVQAPEVARLTKRQKNILELRVKSERLFPAIRFGLPLPEDILAELDQFSMSIPKVNSWYCLSWEVEPQECGQYGIDLCCLEVPSKLGFWNLHRRVEIDTEVRVYPNLRRERKAAAALFLNRGDNGGHTWRQLGKGREFEKLREYIPGDTYQDIHWKTTAKRQHPVTKVYQIERTQEVYVVLDSSRLSSRKVSVPDSDESVTLLERFISSALMLALAAEQQGDLFGLIEFGAKPNLFIKASSGKAHFDTIRNSLYTLLPEHNSPDYAEVISFIRTRLRKRALVVFLTSLDDPVVAEQFLEHIPLLSRQHFTVVNMMKSGGMQPLFTGDEVTHEKDLYERLGGHVAWRKLYELELRLKAIGVPLNMLENERLSSELITQYMQVKQKQLI